jgi:LPS sulfotransferase NodH
MDISQFITFLKGMGYTNFIVLQRKNYLRRSISVEKGRKSNVWHTSTQQKKTEKLFLDVNNVHTVDYTTTLLELFKIIDENYDKINQLLSNENVLHLNYEEDILLDPQIGYRKVCEFLELKEEAPEIELEKTNPFGVSEMLENFKEVEDLLKNTDYEWMLYN